MICVSIGRGRHRHLLAELRHLAENGVKLVELRVDFIQGTVQIKRLLRDRPCPVIVTCRRQVDGGHWQGSEEDRLLMLRTAIAEGVDYIDLESDVAAAVPRYGKTKRIVSHHDFTRTPTDLMTLHRRLATMDADIVKVATMANHPNDNLRMLDMVRAARVPTVGVCMGDMGVPSRLLTVRAGSPFTFATFQEDRVMAPGQVTWKQMRDRYRVDAIHAGTRIYGVIADPVAHSLSPVVHNAACAEAGIDCVYIPFRVPAQNLDEFLSTAGRWPLAGLSVTIPHKESVMTHATPADDLVGPIGAANTLTFSAEGVRSFNTDAVAAVASLESLIDEGELAGRDAIRTALVMGAGGAARAVAFGLRSRGIDVTISGRTPERARAIAAAVGCKTVDWPARHRLPYDCIVNATPIGMHPDVNESPFDAESLRTYMVVFDTVYNPENTLLVKQAREAGCRVVTGVEMFVRQASAQFRIWHGSDPSEGVMRDALKRATAAYKPD